MAITLLDLDHRPLTPKGLILANPQPEEFKNTGLWQPGRDRLSLYFSDRQKKEGLTGNDLLLKIIREKISVANAIILDYLLANPHLIPEAWYGKDLYHDYNVFFFGNIYREKRSDKPCVRYLYWEGYLWNDGYRCLDEVFDSCDPVVRREELNEESE